MSQMLRAFIISLRARHRAILLTTHDLDEAQRIADRVVVLYKGKVLRTGATADVRAAGRPSYTVAFAGDAAVARDALARAGIQAESASARDGLFALRFDADDPASVNPAVARDALARAGIQAENASSRDGLVALRFAAHDPASVNPAALRALLDAGVRVVTLSAEERSLEDAYLSILAEARR